MHVLTTFSSRRLSQLVSKIGRINTATTYLYYTRWAPLPALESCRSLVELCWCWKREFLRFVAGEEHAAQLLCVVRHSTLSLSLSALLVRTPGRKPSAAQQKHHPLDSHLQVPRHRVLQPGDGQPRKRQRVPVTHLVVGNSRSLCRLLVLLALDGGGVRDGPEGRGSSSRAVPPEPCPAGNRTAEWQRHVEEAASNALCLLNWQLRAACSFPLCYCSCCNLNLDSLSVGFLSRDQTTLSDTMLILAKQTKMLQCIRCEPVAVCFLEGAPPRSPPNP